MTGEVKHFHGTVMKCSAIVTDWVELNKLNNRSDRFFEYLGNYMDDDSDTVWAMFGDFPKRYVIKID